MAHMIREPAASRAWAPAALCAVILLSAFALWPRPRPVPAPSGRPSVEAASPAAAIRATVSDSNRAELELLKAQVAGLRDQLAESDRARQTAPAATEPAAAPATAPLEGPEIRVRYDRLFDDEVADQNWARAERQTLANFFDGDPSNGRVDALECKRSMCRARLAFQTRRARDQFLVKVGSPPLEKSSFWNSNPEGTNLTLFLAREGQELPDVSQE